MEIRELDEALRWQVINLKLDLLLLDQVINRGAPSFHVQPGSRVERDEVRPIQIALDDAKPAVDPDKRRSNTCAGCAGVAQAPPPSRAAGIHRPVSSRSAKRSGSFAFLIARCAPLMS
jgi:hypothetical protein